MPPLRSGQWAWLSLDALGFKRKIILSHGLLMLLTVLVAGNLIVTSRTILIEIQRARLADAVHLGYHALERHALELYFELTNSSGASDAVASGTAQELIEGLQADVVLIRHAIAQEVLAGHEEDTVELDRLARIEAHVRSLASSYDNSAPPDGRRPHHAAIDKLVELLGTSEAGSLRQLIRIEVDHESDEARSADMKVDELVKRSSRLATGFAAAVVLLGIASIVLLQRNLNRRLQALVFGAEAVARGDFEHRIVLRGDDEIAVLSRRFNSMAQDLKRRQDELRASANELERRIEERTLELSAANARLKATDDLRHKFLADVSHELRTPLTIIRGEADVSLRGAEKSVQEYQKALHRIQEQAAHTTVLVDDLLFIARGEAGEVRFKQQTIAIANLVAKICDEASVLGSDTGITVELSSLVDGATVVGDPDRLRQLLLILLDNAMRYSSPHSAVQVSLAGSTAGIALRVADRGIGIAPEELDRVFDRYYRGDNAGKLYSEGTGLGLPMAKAIVEAHKGSIEIASELGGGTVVTVTLPSVRKIRAIA